MLATTASLSAAAASLDPNRSINQFAHTSWSAKDGIPGPVRAILQTKDEYFWLGTAVGLFRFDGVHFVSWEKTAGGELPRKSTLALFAASGGSLWIGFSSGPIGWLQNGLLRIYSTTDGFNKGVMAFAEGSDEFPAPGAQKWPVDRNGALPFATNGEDFSLAHDIRVNTILKLTRLRLTRGSKRFEATDGTMWMAHFNERAAGGVFFLRRTWLVS